MQVKAAFNNLPGAMRAGREQQAADAAAEKEREEQERKRKWQEEEDAITAHELKKIQDEMKAEAAAAKMDVDA